MAANKLYFFSGRRTPVVATSAKAARAKKRRGGDKIVSVRTPSAAQRRQIAAGKWVGTPKDRRHLRGHGPRPKRKN